MARFPTREGDIKTLAQNIVTGLTANPAVFPAPPITPAALQALLNSTITVDAEAVAARALAEQASLTKDGSYEELTNGMKTVLRYAEGVTNNDNTKLGLIGWGGKAAGTALVAPGQPGNLTATQQGETSISLSWDAPDDGGAVASYKIERRERPAGPWMIVGIATDTESTLTEQEKAKPWEFRVTAVNKAGESAPSNTVPAVL
jgi:hypothetical protein